MLNDFNDLKTLGKRTTNIAVLGELGRYPLLLEVI
jgi:hypothetical protein